MKNMRFYQFSGNLWKNLLLKPMVLGGKVKKTTKKQIISQSDIALTQLFIFEKKTVKSSRFEGIHTKICQNVFTFFIPAPVARNFK